MKISKKYLFLILTISTVALAGLPPTATKLSGESSFKTTFNTDFGSLTGTRSGTTITPNQTGTGSLVLSNSPTLATPNIGAATATSLSMGAGSSSVPSLFFDGYTTTGLYSPAANQVAFTVSGTPRVTIQPSGTVYTAPNYVANGSVGAPSYSFTSGTTSGLYRDNTTAGIRMSAVGTDSMTWSSSGNVGIGTTSPNANAILDVSSTTKAFMPPRMTTAQKTAISSPTAGMYVYDSTLNASSWYNGSSWVDGGTVQAGGTGQTSVTTGDMFYASASNTVSKLAIGGTGNYLTVTAGVPSWSAVSPNAIKIATLRDVKTSGTSGGTSSSTTWHTRVLNTESDPSSIVTLSANQFTLAAGTYYIYATAPARNPAQNKLKIRNITDSTDDIIGMSRHSDQTTGSVDDASLSGIVTIAGSKTFELQHYISAGRATDGLGLATGDGTSEVYATVVIEQM